MVTWQDNQFLHADTYWSGSTFLVFSFALHAVFAVIAYSTGLFSTDDIDSIPAKVISVRIVEPQIKTPPPTKPIQKPQPKKVIKKKIITKAPTVRKATVKPKKIAKKPVEKQPAPKAPQVAASPIPSPVAKPATFAAPQPSYQPKPKYPTIARRRGLEGIVILEISLTSSGHVSNVFIVKGSGSSALDRSALKAVKTWRFPASRFNSITSFKQKIEFRLNQY
ncbi:MAG: energy transducer TonB [Piscirickettsiaceae bacterium]|nr:MAG: energy transducer TonB [Piscirickettsiaceae bacterium]PCI65978.1 MAG: energy transducer TonB [Piscirickettsiaceae bacterium]